MMSSRSFFCLLVLLSAGCTDAFVLRGRHERRTAAGIREFQRARRNQTIKIHRDFLPLYPEEPLIFEVKIGTPKDKTEPLMYKLALSTANPSMWTLDVSYEGLTKDNVPYDHQASKTADYRGRYYSYTDDTQLYGLQYTDVLNITTLGDYALVFNQSFGVVQSATDPDSSVSNPSFPADGVFGLSWDVDHPVVDPDEDSAPVLNILHRAPDVKRGNYFYTLWLTNSSSPDKDAGRHYDWQLTFGALDHDHCDRHYNTTYLDWYTEYAPTVFYMNAFRFGDIIEEDVGDEAFMIDTGSPVIFFPENIYSTIYYALNPDYDWDLGYYTVDCGEAGNFPDWEFYLTADVAYKVPSTTYVVDVGLDYNECVVAFAKSENDQQPDWILGNPFLIEHCVLFDTSSNTIGFAKANVKNDA